MSKPLEAAHAKDGAPDIAPGRLAPAEYHSNFGDIETPLGRAEALVDASRCYFCYDAPCIEACPTGIDIPGFIRKITTGNVKGAAVTIFEQNIFGGACAQGHPIGSTGSRLIVTLAHALKRRGAKRGIAALCIGGGEATAVALECP